MAWFAITTKTPIHGILTLICLFVVSAFLFITLYGLEFIGILLLVIYVGAIAVLFVFVVIILPTRDLSLISKSHSGRFLGIVLFAVVLLAIFAAAFYIFAFYDTVAFETGHLFNHNPFTDFENDISDQLINIDVYGIGKTMYQYNSLPLISSAVLLFVALVVAIILCDDRTQSRL